MRILVTPLMTRRSRLPWPHQTTLDRVRIQTLAKSLADTADHMRQILELNKYVVALQRECRVAGRSEERHIAVFGDVPPPHQTPHASTPAVPATGSYVYNPNASVAINCAPNGSTYTQPERVYCSVHFDWVVMLDTGADQYAQFGVWLERAATAARSA